MHLGTPCIRASLVSWPSDLDLTHGTKTWIICTYAPAAHTQVNLIFVTNHLQRIDPELKSNHYIWRPAARAKRIPPRAAPGRKLFIRTHMW